MEALPARKEAQRGAFDPMYLNYTLGKLMILKLREDYRRAQGGAYNLRALSRRILVVWRAANPACARNDAWRRERRAL